MSNNVDLTSQRLSLDVNRDNCDVTVSSNQPTTEVTTNQNVFEIRREDNEVKIDATQGRPNISIGTGGAQGPPGPPGADGVGIPAGGIAGQVLSKVDGSDYNTQWVTPSSISDPYGFASYWMTLARGFSSIPSQIGVTGTGDVWEYNYSNGTLYRYIATDLSLDAFYTTWDGSNVSGLVTQKEITLI